MDGPRVVLLVLVFFFLFATPDTQRPSPTQQREIGRKVDGLQQALVALSNVSYGDFAPSEHKWLNSTGLREQDDFNWRLLPLAQKVARRQLLQLYSKAGGVTQKDTEEGDEAAYGSVVPQRLPQYQNISGEIRGKFQRQPIPGVNSRVNLTELGLVGVYASHDFQRNITEQEGDIAIELTAHNDYQSPVTDVSKYANRQNNTRKVTAKVQINTDSSPGNGWQMELHGTHFLRSGSVLLATTSERFYGLFALPNFALYEPDFISSYRILNETLPQKVGKWIRKQEPGIPFHSSPMNAETALFPVPSCEYIIWLQQQPVSFPGWSADSDRTQAFVQQIEQELRYPAGAALPQAPPLRFSAVVLSPDCGFLLESESSDSMYHLSGPKREIYWTLIRRLVVAFIIVLGMQMALLKRQMEDTSTPSTRSRVSFQSLAIMAYGDGLIISGLVGLLIINDSASLLIIAATFLCLLNAAFLEMKFIFDIWTVQVGDPRQAAREREARATAAAAPPAPASTDAGTTTTTAPVVNSSTDPATGLPLPVTAPRPIDTGATPIILPPDQDIEAAVAEDQGLMAQPTATTTTTFRSRPAEFSALYSRFYFSLVALMFLSIWATSWPKPIRSAYVNLLCFLYLSFWLPQIYRNVMRNCRQALRWEYVFGNSILRLTPIVYCYTKQGNILFVDTDWTAAYVLVGWVWLQVMALLSQQFLGPRLLVKEAWCPPAYDYHPVLRADEDDPEAGGTLPIGFVASASEAKEKDDVGKDGKENRRTFDCAICMNEIDVPVVSGAGGKDMAGMGTGWLERLNYMVTPCRHIFHSQCLEGWMRLRLVCPICRESLPPL